MNSTQATADPSEHFEPIRFPPRTVAQHLCALAEASDYDNEPVPDDLRRASAKRLREFRAGRWCARCAIRKLGYEAPSLIGRRSDGAPVWPANIVGSITHAGSFAWAAVAGAAQTSALGIDTEVVMGDDEAAQVLEQICTPSEVRRAASLGSRSLGEYVTLLFSAKESVHKCSSLITGLSFDPLAYELAHITATRIIVTVARSRTRSDRALPRMAARYRRIGNQIYTACIAVS